MSNFKPMVKMYTDEPAVSLKLKKGGKVHHKGAKHHKEHEEHGHKPMHHAHGGMHHAFESEAGHSPKKPSHAARHKAMNPNLYAKGGKVAHKGMGGMMPAGAPQGMGTAPQGMPGMTGVGMGSPTMPKALRPAAIANMAPSAQVQRAAMVKKALMGMKKGGSADHKHIEALEKELHHHESMSMEKAHHKKHGGMAHHAHGGKVHHVSGHPDDSHEHHKHMAKHHAKMHKESGSAHHKKKAEHHKAMCKGGGYAEGGAIDKDMTKTTLKNSVKPFVSRADTSRPDHSPAHTGEIHKGNGGGYKTGGATKAYAAGGTIEGNEGRFENTKVNTARPFSGSKDTGGVRMSNAGGFKKGGTIEGGNWENRAANTTPKGVSGTKTGEVKLANAGGYKSGGKTSKKAYATGGNVVDDGKAVKMPHHFVSRPVANSLQSGTFKRGGKVKHHAAGGSEPFGTFEDEDSASVAKKAKPAPKPSKSKEEAERIRLRDEGMNMFDDQSAKAKGGRAKK